MKVLIINDVNGADILFSTPLVRVLKVQLKAEIHYATQSIGLTLLERNPYIHQLYSLEETSFRTLRNVKADIVIDLQNTFRSACITRFVRGRIFRVASSKYKFWLKSRLKIDKLSARHISDQWLEALKPVGIKSDEMGLDYFIPEKYEVPSEWLPAGFQKDYVVFYLDALYETRRLPLKRIIELCDKINKPIILLGGSEYISTGTEVEEFFNNSSSHDFEKGLKELNKKTRVYNGCGKFGMHQIASVINKAQHVFTFDSVGMAIASAFKKNIFSIWGNTILTFGRYPYQTRFTVLENNKIQCRPCSSKGYAKCPLGHFKCMNEIVFDFYLP